MNERKPVFTGAFESHEWRLIRDALTVYANQADEDNPTQATKADSLRDKVGKLIEGFE